MGSSPIFPSRSFNCNAALVLNPWNIDGPQEIEAETGARIYNILQLRLRPSIIALRDPVQAAGDSIHQVDISDITYRGNWYQRSWNGQIEKSGGIATNIGVHFFDMLTWVFGKVRYSTVHINRDDCAAGHLELAQGHVRWFLSVNAEHLPEAQRAQGQRTFRSITVGGEDIEFSDGCTDLHIDRDRHILAGEGFAVEDARSAVETVHQIRNAAPQGLQGDYHPLCVQIR